MECGCGVWLGVEGSVTCKPLSVQGVKEREEGDGLCIFEVQSLSWKSIFGSSDGVSLLQYEYEPLLPRLA